jgi:hypothetical protein
MGNSPPGLGYPVNLSLSLFGVKLRKKNMKKIFLFAVYSFVWHLAAQNSYNELHDQSGGITNGYGSWGRFSTVREIPVNDTLHDGIITFYRPDTAVSRLPVIFFISGWGRQAYTYEKLFEFLASQGYAVVNIYNNNPGYIATSYNNALAMILESGRQLYPQWIDTARVGLAGHSFGAGATVWLGKHLFGDSIGWGNNGRFIFMTAPWYSHLVTVQDLQNYPPGVKMLVEINNDDFSHGQNGSTWNTSERAIRGMFEMIRIADTEKDLLRIYSDPATYQYDSDNDGNPETYSYLADHYVSYTGVYTAQGEFKPWDAMDVYAVNRLLHALAAYVFTGDTLAKDVALGNGSNLQTDMGFLTPAEENDYPVITRAEDDFAYPCNEDWYDFETGQNTWLLQSTCADSDNDGIIDLLDQTGIETTGSISIKAFPVPVRDILELETGNLSVKEIKIYNLSGQQINNVFTDGKPDFRNLPPAVYIIRIYTSGNKIYTLRVIKI